MDDWTALFSGIHVSRTNHSSDQLEADSGYLLFKFIGYIPSYV